MHSLVYSELADSHVKLIIERMASLAEALEQICAREDAPTLPDTASDPSLRDDPFSAATSR
jgi:hypothetical protein